MPSKMSDATKKKTEEFFLAKSKDWRMHNFYKITDKNSNLINFNLNQAQLHFKQNAANRNIILKARQLGFTTFSVLDMLDDVLFNKNFRALLISYDLESAHDLFDNKVMLAWQHFPWKPYYNVSTERSDQLQVEFGPTGIYSGIQVKNSGRSGTFNRVHISEFAKICARYPEKSVEIITGTIPSVPLDGRLDIESTAEGEQGAFYSMYWEAANRPKNQQKRQTEFKAHFYNWQWDLGEISKITQPDAQLPIEFKDFQRKHNEKSLLQPEQYTFMNDIQITYLFYKWLSLDRNWNRLRQEYPTTAEDAFISSGSKFFDVDLLEKMKQRAKDPIETYNGWSIWKPYIPNHRYAIGADVGGGIGRDSSTAVVVDFTGRTPEVVATYASNKVAPDLFAHELTSAGFRFGTCLIAPEVNLYGHATITELKRIYPVDRIYKQIKYNKVEDKETETLGWDTNMSTKPHMMYELRTALNDGLIDVPSKALINEMRYMDTGQLSKLKVDDEDATNHFDLVIALAIAYQMRNHLQMQDMTPYTLSTTSSNQNPFDGI